VEFLPHNYILMMFPFKVEEIKVPFIKPHSYKPISSVTPIVLNLILTHVFNLNTLSPRVFLISPPQTAELSSCRTGTCTSISMIFNLHLNDVLAGPTVFHLLLGY